MSSALEALFAQITRLLGKKGICYYRSLLVQFLTCDNIFEADVLRESMHEYLTRASAKQQKTQSGGNGSGVISLHNQLMNSLLAPPSTDEEEAVAGVTAASGTRRQRDDNGPQIRESVCETQCLGHVSTMPLGVFVSSMCKRQGVESVVGLDEAVLDAAKDCVLSSVSFFYQQTLKEAES